MTEYFAAVGAFVTSAIGIFLLVSVGAVLINSIKEWLGVKRSLSETVSRLADGQRALMEAHKELDKRLRTLDSERTCYFYNTDHEYENSVRCSACQESFARPWEPFHYCPNCGARVEGAEQ